jgi:hypothetical protein
MGAKRNSRTFPTTSLSNLVLFGLSVGAESLQGKIVQNIRNRVSMSFGVSGTDSVTATLTDSQLMSRPAKCGSVD